MSKRVVGIIVMVLAAALIAGNLFAADPEKPAAPAVKADSGAAKAAKYEYVGDTKCKLCHKAIHDSWATTVHAKAFDALKPEEQKKEECVGCHSTGKDATGKLLTGVQCEACHGPGSAYKAMNIMKDAKLAAANGLIMPTKETCVTCHNDKSPTFKGFEFDKAVKDPKAIHAIPVKTKTEEKKG